MRTLRFRLPSFLKLRYLIVLKEDCSLKAVECVTMSEEQKELNKDLAELLSKHIDKVPLISIIGIMEAAKFKLLSMKL